jgi:hypothetical protein
MEPTKQHNNQPNVANADVLVLVLAGSQLQRRSGTPAPPIEGGVGPNFVCRAKGDDGLLLLGVSRAKERPLPARAGTLCARSPNERSASSTRRDGGASLYLSLSSSEMKHAQTSSAFDKGSRVLGFSLDVLGLGFAFCVPEHGVFRTSVGAEGGRHVASESPGRVILRSPPAFLGGMAGGR